VRSRLYNIARRTMSQDRRNRLKRQIWRTRLRLAPLYRARYGTFGAGALRAELARHLPADTEIVMVHSSLGGLQPMYTGDIRELLEALIELCGTHRTLAMPAFFFGGRNLDPIAYYRARPVFDVRHQPSETGLLTERFRRREGVRRSLHPIASVTALGPKADELVARHHLAKTSFGEGTPFAIMAELRTAIVGIGAEYFRSLTQVHAAEDLLGERYPLAVRPSKLPIQLTDFDGTVHHYELPFNESVMGRRIERLEQLLGPEELAQWHFHGVPLFVTSAARVTEVLIDAALRGETIYDAMPIRKPLAPRKQRSGLHRRARKWVSFSSRQTRSP
jgi:aminoglycoside 3-N-acetyltransferase